MPKKDRPSKDMDVRFRKIFDLCSPYTMTSVNSMYSLFQSVIYIVDNKIDGDFVECGVWRGGSAMIIAETLSMLGVSDRKIYLYDTFEGMPRPGEKDSKIRGITSANEMWEKEKNKNGGWYIASIEEVAGNLKKTNYQNENFILVKGVVEDTIPETIPQSISLLRLDTDFYTSTYHEFTHLYPILSQKGVLIIDDYGSWRGSRDATDKYFKEKNINLFLHKIDTGSIAIKV